MRFAGKTVVVLGGNSGIGLAAARAFQAEARAWRSPVVTRKHWRR